MRNKLQIDNPFHHLPAIWLSNDFPFREKGKTEGISCKCVK